MKTDTRLLIYRDKQRFTPECSYYSLLSRRCFRASFSFSNLLFMFSLHYGMYYPSLNKCCQNDSFWYRTDIAFKKMYPNRRIWVRSGARGVGNCLFLLAQGWEINHQETNTLQIPGDTSGGWGAWLQVKLNHALRVNFHYRATFACLHTSILCG